MKRYLLISILTVAVLGLGSCGDDDGVPTGSGFIEATETIVSAEVAGRLEEIYVAEGGRIERGDAVGLIDTTTLSLKLAQVRALLAAAGTREISARLQIQKAELDSSLAGTDYRRMKNLIAKESVSQQQYDQAENRYLQARLAAKLARASLDAARADRQRAEAEMDLLEKQLGDCRPVSPIAGTVVTAYVEPGELVGVGKPLIKVANLDPVTVKIYLPPEFLTQVRLGAQARVDPEDGRTDPISGQVSWISPEAEFTPKNVQTKEARADLVYAVKITIPNPDETLKIGMPVLVTIP
jgi:HlyD family secretion protein